MTALRAPCNQTRFHLCEALAILDLGGHSNALFEYARQALCAADTPDEDRDFIHRAALTFAKHLDRQGTDAAQAEARMLRSYVENGVARN